MTTTPIAKPRVAGKVLIAGTAVVCIATSAPPPVPPPNVPMWSIAAQPLVLPCGTAEVWVAKSGKAGLGITVLVTPSQQAIAGQQAAVVAVDPNAPTQAGDPNAPRPMQVAGDPNAPAQAEVAGAPDAPAQVAGGPALDERRSACDATIAAKLTFPDRAFEGVLVVSKRASELTPAERRGDPDERDRRLGSIEREGTYHYLGFQLDNEERWNRGDRTATVELDIYIAGRRQSWSLPATHAYKEFPARRRW